MIVKFAENKQELDAIIELRYHILRKPWQQAFDTSSDGQEDTAHNAFIADDNNKVVACGRLQKNSSNVGQIRYMAVDNASQGKGFGKKILQALEEKAREIGLSEIELQARENAVDFYKANNYKLIEKSFVLWNIIPHFLMRKKL
jgi:N-acetylglutamate synthase-like GNAT family acetyltransferase